jgi:hypothetical protein
MRASNKNQDTSKADILFCHSTGCYLVPENAKAKLIVLVGLPYWPNRSLVYSGIKSFTEDLLKYKKRYGASLVDATKLCTICGICLNTLEILFS